MNPKLKNILKYLLFLGIGGFLFYLAFRNTEFEKLVEDFKHANYGYVLASMVMGYLAFISRGIRWTLLLEPLGKKPNKWNAINAVTVGYFSNVLVPRAGELARCTALHSTDKIKVDRLFGTVILERLIDGLMLMLLILLTFVLKFDELMSFFNSAFSNNDTPEDSSGLVIKISIAAVILGGLIAVYFLRHKFAHLPGYVKARNFWWGIKDGIRSIGKMRSIWPFVLHTLFIWALYYGMLYVCFFALDTTDHLSPADGLFIMIVAGLGMVVPTPGGIGAYHYLVMLGLSIYGIPKDDGVSFATLVHTCQLVMILISGIFAFAGVYRARRRTNTENSVEPPPKTVFKK